MLIIYKIFSYSYLQSVDYYAKLIYNVLGGIKPGPRNFEPWTYAEGYI